MAPLPTWRSLCCHLTVCLQLFCNASLFWSVVLHFGSVRQCVLSSAPELARRQQKVLDQYRRSICPEEDLDMMEAFRKEKQSKQ